MTSDDVDPQFTSGWTAVPDARIYWESSGAIDGIAVLYLHGGPGSSLGNGGYRKHHEPQRFRTVGMDQRGCGRSVPRVQDDLGNLSRNNTQTLIEDIDAVRADLGIERWIVTGVSWGSTLALAYALAHPDRVIGIALVAVTTTSRREVDWITEGVGSIFPEAWQNFATAAHARDGERTVEAYARRLAGPDREDARAAAMAWNEWESTHVSLDPSWTPGPLFTDEQESMTFALLVTHYWSRDGFLSGEGQIIPRIHQLNGIPAHLIHGRRDVSGPAVTAWMLHQRWSGSTLTIVEAEGHGGPESMAELTQAVEQIAAGANE